MANITYFIMVLFNIDKNAFFAVDFIKQHNNLRILGKTLHGNLEGNFMIKTAFFPEVPHF
jgi:hypothetical protein